jgi:hypothetical protein
MRPRTNWWLGAVFVLVLGASIVRDGLAEALAPVLTPVAAARSQAVTDGVRYAAWLALSGSIVLLDTSANTRRTLRPPPAACSLDAMGGRWLVLGCPSDIYGDLSLLMYDRATREFFTPPGSAAIVNLEHNAGAPGVTFEAVGANWIAVRVAGHEPSPNTFSYVNWHTGAVSSGYSGDARPTDAVDLDLAGPTPTRPMCAPLKRVHATPDSLGVISPQPYVPAIYLRPFAVEPEYDYTNSRFQLLLFRCGHARRIQRFSQAYGIFAPQSLTRRYVVWQSAAATMSVYRLADGKRFAWAVSGPSITSAAATDNTLFVSSGRGDNPPRSAFSIYQARLPPRRP